MANAVASNADQSGSSRRHAQRQGADRGRFGKCRHRDELPNRGVGPRGEQHSHAIAAVGYVLQRHGCPARWPSVHQRRQPAVRPVPRGASELRVRSGARCIHGSGKHGAWALVSDGHDARRRPRHDLFGVDRDRRDEHRRRDLHRGLGMERRVSGRLDAAALSAHAPDAGRSSVLLRLGHRIQDFQSHHAHMVGGSGQHEVQRHADVRLFSPAAPDPGEWLHSTRDHHGRRQPGHGHHRNHRSFIRHSTVAVRPGDVAAADRDERDDPAERQGAGAWRIDQRRRRGHSEFEGRSLRPDDEHVQFGRRQRVSASVPFRLAAPSGRHRHARRWKPRARLVRTTYRDLFAAVSVQHRWQRRRQACHHQCES